MTETVGTTGGAGTSERAIEVVHGFSDVFAAGDVPGTVAFLDPGVEWRAAVVPAPPCATQPAFLVA